MSLRIRSPKSPGVHLGPLCEPFRISDCETRCVYKTVINKMAALGYVYTLEKQTLCSPKRCTSQNATSAEFLEVQIHLHVLVNDWEP